MLAFLPDSTPQSGDLPNRIFLWIISRSVAKKMFKKSACLTRTMAFPFIFLAIKGMFYFSFLWDALGRALPLPMM
jgi:hypothetical protein